MMVRSLRAFQQVRAFRNVRRDLGCSQASLLETVEVFDSLTVDVKPSQAAISARVT